MCRHIYDWNIVDSAVIQPFSTAQFKYALPKKKKKETHNILVHKQVQIIVAVTPVLYIINEVKYKENNFESFWYILSF